MLVETERRMLESFGTCSRRDMAERSVVFFLVCIEKVREVVGLHERLSSKVNTEIESVSSSLKWASRLPLRGFRSFDFVASSRKMVGIAVERIVVVTIYWT
jgi:hypothetical protein